MKNSSKGFRALCIAFLFAVCLGAALPARAATPGRISQEQYDSAKRASEIISTVRHIKACAIMYWSDAMDDPNVDYRFNLATLWGYMDPQPPSVTEPALARIVGKQWWVGYTVSQETQGVRDMLKKRAESTGLMNGNGAPYDGGPAVYVVAVEKPQ